ncbi:NADH oxidase [Pelotomaculum sp. FP]|uniref:oxidoreductase n=1 Tax=Pelotomaculum sp. FP TaxID=261474 RepID=UPI001065B30B|nr:FAD-dependent oxidoreductase [Pelotomaculum sp. FP]TEB16391.1 NADH oxidase [Pelotomaculum sp. FP]
MSFKNLLSPIKIGTMDVKNRFVVPPMGTNFGNKDGSVSETTVAYLAERAKGGFGLIIVEVTAVESRGKSIPYSLGLWSDEHIKGFKRLADAVHAHGAKLVVQLVHAGRQGAKAYCGEDIVAPTPIPDPLIKEVPKELATEEIYKIINKFGMAAKRAKSAGADGVEIHGANGMLISQFMSPYANKRVDEFGGDFKGRMKFPVAVVKSVRDAVGPDYPVLFRLSSEEKTPGGTSPNDTPVIAKLMEDNSVDAIHVSITTFGRIEWLFVPSAVPPAFNIPATTGIKKAVNIPVIAVGRINDPYLAERIIATGQADMIALGRESLADPEIPNKVAADLTEEIAPCIYCNQGCVGYLFNPNILKLSCLVRPFTGKEDKIKIKETENKKKIMIVGGGPSGLEAAWICAKRGHDVTCYEKDSHPGGKFRIAGMAPTRQEILAAIKYYMTMGKKYGVKYVFNTEVTPEMVKQEEPDAVILATGGIVRTPSVKGSDNPKFFTVEDVLSGKSCITGGNTLVVGSTYAADVADYLGERSWGSKVTVVHPQKELPAGYSFVTGIWLNQRLKDYGVQVISRASIKEVFENGVIYEIDGKEEKLEGFDNVVLAYNYSSYNPLEEKIKGFVEEVYVVGDAVHVRGAIKAIEEGMKIAVSI